VVHWLIVPARPPDDGVASPTLSLRARR
jgi:hypothetical protein